MAKRGKVEWLFQPLRNRKREVSNAKNDAPIADYRLLRKEFGAGSASRPDAVARIETSEGNRPNAILKKKIDFEN